MVQRRRKRKRKTPESAQGFFKNVLFDNRGCGPCTLNFKRSKQVSGSGKRDADLMFVGEAPGRNEENKKRVFIGRAGKLYNALIRECGLSRRDIFTANAVRCFPVKGSEGRNPSANEIHCCSKFLEEDIKRHQPRVIVAMGNAACKSLLGESGITGLRDRVFLYKDGSTYVIPTWHPSGLLRQGGNIDSEPCQEFIADVKKAQRYLRKRPPKLRTIVANSPKKAMRLLDEVLLQNRTTIDAEWKGDLLLSIAFTIYRGKKIIGLCIPLEHPESKNLVDGYLHSIHQGVWIRIRRILKRKRIRIVGQNFNQSDRNHLEEFFECNIEGVDWDTMFASAVDDERQGFHRMELISGRFAGLGNYDYEFERYLKQHKLPKSQMDKVPVKVLGKYNALDALVCDLSFRGQKKEFGYNFRQLTRLLTEASRAVNEMETFGLRFDMKYSQKLQKYFTKRLIKLERKIKSYAVDWDLKITSPPQVGKFIYQEQKMHKSLIRNGYELDSFKTAKGNWRTDDTTLKLLFRETQNPFLKALTEYRDADKNNGTYVIGLQELMDADHRLRTSTNLLGAESGRASNRLHNTKHVYRVENGKEVDILWNQFIAEDGYVLLKADYSQMEMRVMAEMSGDPALLEVFERGRDPHTETAIWAFGLDKKLKNKGEGEERRVIAKTFNFGTMYGLDEDGLYRYCVRDIEGFSLTKAQVSEFHGNIFKRYKRLREWQLDVIDFAREHGYVEGLFGQTRRLDMSQGKHSENQAVNTPIQGSAHWILLIALVQLFYLPNRDFRILLDHHDAIWFEVPKKSLKYNAKRIKHEMINPDTKRWFNKKLKIKLEAEMKYGRRAGDVRGIS